MLVAAFESRDGALVLKGLRGQWSNVYHRTSKKTVLPTPSPNPVTPLSSSRPTAPLSPFLPSLTTNFTSPDTRTARIDDLNTLAHSFVTVRVCLVLPVQGKKMVSAAMPPPPPPAAHPLRSCHRTSPLFHKHRHAVQQDGHHRLSKYTRVREAIAS
ncbi:unnamed protein product [Pylaiella littoralis]